MILQSIALTITWGPPLKHLFAHILNGYLSAIDPQSSPSSTFKIKEQFEEYGQDKHIGVQ